jgi:hypothetical protein
VRAHRRGARRRSSVERRTVNSYVRERSCGPSWDTRDRDRSPWYLRNIDVHLRHVSAAHSDADCVPARVARFGLYGPIVVVFCYGMMIAIGKRRMLVLVDSRPVVMVRMIVFDVLVYVQRRDRRRRYDPGGNKRKSDEPAHDDSLLRPAPPRQRGGEAQMASRDRRPNDLRGFAHDECRGGWQNPGQCQ